MLVCMVFFFLTSFAFKTALLTYLLFYADMAETKNKFTEAARAALKGKVIAGPLFHL